MLKLLDGPAKGAYAVKRAPLYLRAVVATTGKADVLDQLDDKPGKTETVHVYKLQGEAGMAHVNRGRHGRGFFATGEYLHLPDVDGEQLRETAAWQEWCIERSPGAINPLTMRVIQ